METAELARQILDILPQVMGQIRQEMRRALPPGISAPQFRVLAGIVHGMNQVCSLAKHQGISQPAMSKVVDRLARQGLIRRVPEPEDRRRVELRLTQKGQRLFMKIRTPVQARLAERLASLDSEGRDRASLGLLRLREVFVPEKKVRA